MTRREDVFKRPPSAEARRDEVSDRAPSRDARQVERVDTSTDATLVESLQAFENNTIARTGTVVSGFVVDYAAGTTPTDVRETVRSEIAETTVATTETALERVVDSSETVIEGEYSGVHAFVLVRLPSGHVFVDRIGIPDGADARSPEVERYEAFVEEYGSFELLPELEEEPVPIEHSATADRWMLNLDDSASAAIGGIGPTFPVARRAGVYGVLAGLFGYGWVQLATVASGPSIGAVSPRSALLASMVVLLVAFGIDVVRSGIEWLEASTAPRG